jgi:hypothetical protein
MMDMGMIVNPDHMSQRGVDDTLTIAESRNYSGVISPHGWMDPRNWPRIWQLGGMAFPAAGSASGFVDAWRKYRPKATPYYFGWGYGADMGGLGTQGGPPAADSRVGYPFKSIDGSTSVTEQHAGNRTFDYNRDGVANYGLYADWAEEVSNDGGPKITRDMLRGAEAYLEMWERAEGVPASRCQSSRPLTSRGLGKLRLGMRDKALLERAGQPLTRTRAWSWCVKGKRNRRAAATAVLTPRGKVALVASSAEGQGALGVAPGDSAARLRGRAKEIGGGVWVAKRFAFVVRNGTVRTAAVAGGPAAQSTAKLRSYLRRVAAKISRRPSTVEGAAPRSLSPERAVPLVAQRGAPQFPAFVCAL